MKLAFAVKHLGASQFNHDLILNTNRVMRSRSDLDISVLFEDVARPCIPLHFSSMHIIEGWGYDGAVIATNLSTAEKMIRFPCVSKRLFYAYDLEWLRLAQKPFRQLRAIYGHPDVILAARCKDHADVMSKAWNRTVEVVESVDIERLLELVS